MRILEGEETRGRETKQEAEDIIHVYIFYNDLSGFGLQIV